MEKRVIHEIRLSKPLMAVAIIAAFGLLAIGLKPVIEAAPAFAQSDQVHKIAICGTKNLDLSGKLNCGIMFGDGNLRIRTNN